MHLAILVLHYVENHHTALLSLVGGSAGLWTLLQTTLHKLKVQSGLASWLLSHVYAAAGACIAYLLSPSHTNAALAYVFLWLSTQLWHWLALNPMYNKYVLPFLNWLSTQKVNPEAALVAKTVEADVAAAKETAAPAVSTGGFE